MRSRSFSRMYVQCWVATILLTTHALGSADATGERAASTVGALKQVESLVEHSKSMPTYLEQRKIGISINTAIQHLIDIDKLRTGADFRSAGEFIATNQMDDMDWVTTKYQLLLTAVALRDHDAVRELPAVWDELTSATGREDSCLPKPRRDGVVEMVEPKEITCIQKIYQAAAKNELESCLNRGEDNAEIRDIVTADQKDRDADWSKLTSNELKALSKADVQRLRRVKEMIAENHLFTAKDFSNAALVCQHGTNFADYALAHELSICALMLGDTQTSWLCGATYDRMLLSASYSQRFCTQYGGSPMKLRRYSSVGINDRMRLAVVGKSLRQAMDTRL